MNESIRKAAEWLKNEFRTDVDSYGRPKAMMTKVNKAFDMLDGALYTSPPEIKRLSDEVERLNKCCDTLMDEKAVLEQQITAMAKAHDA